MKNIAIVLAGGTGSRMGSPLPKQFMTINNRQVIEYSLDTFNNHPDIDEVAVVIHPEWRNQFQETINRNNWHKLTKVIDGGSERYMSSLNAIMAYIDYPDDTNLLLHDAARPGISASIIDNVISALTDNEAVGVAIPSTDTVWEVHPNIETDHIGRFIARIPERRLMWQAQTPQAFRLPLLRDAYQRALQDPMFNATDDCGVVHRYIPGTKIAVVEGTTDNFKITINSDLEHAANINRTS